MFFLKEEQIILYRNQVCSASSHKNLHVVFLMHGYLDHDQEQPIGCCWLFTFAKLFILFGITKFFR